MTLNELGSIKIKPEELGSIKIKPEELGSSSPMCETHNLLNYKNWFFTPSLDDLTYKN